MSYNKHKKKSLRRESIERSIIDLLPAMQKNHATITINRSQKNLPITTAPSPADITPQFRGPALNLTNKLARPAVQEPPHHTATMASGYGLAGGTYDTSYWSVLWRLWSAAETLDGRHWLDDGYDCESMRTSELRNGDGFGRMGGLRGLGYERGLCIGMRRACGGELSILWRWTGSQDKE